MEPLHVRSFWESYRNFKLPRDTSCDMGDCNCCDNFPFHVLSHSLMIFVTPNTTSRLGIDRMIYVIDDYEFRFVSLRLFCISWRFIWGYLGKPFREDKHLTKGWVPRHSVCRDIYVRAVVNGLQDLSRIMLCQSNC